MAVILPNALVRVFKRAHPQERDSHGTAVPQDWDLITPIGPVPANLTENPDGSFNLRLDPSAWRVREGDKVTDDQGREFFIREGAKLVAIPGCTDVDFVRAVVTLDPPLVP